MSKTDQFGNALERRSLRPATPKLTTTSRVCLILPARGRKPGY
jgi:hypothetical protein